jgi:hypothetical protein
MKTSIILAVAPVATSAFALPEPQKGYRKGKHWGKGKSPIPFTSTYSVVATPYQVVNATDDGSFVYTGGLLVRNVAIPLPCSYRSEFCDLILARLSHARTQAS